MRLSRFFLAALTLSSLTLPAYAQTLSFTAEWNVRVAVDAAKAKSNPKIAKAVGSSLDMIGGSLEIGTVTDHVVFNSGNNSYNIHSRAEAALMISKFLPNATASRSSIGRTDAPYMTSVQFTEERTKGQERKVILDYAHKVSVYSKAGKPGKREQLPYRTADSASLPYLYFHKPLPTGLSVVAMTDGSSTRIFRFMPSPDSVTIDGHAIPSIRLTHHQSNPNDAGLTLWVRKTDGFPLRARLDMNSRYGAILDQEIAAIPKGV